MGWAEHVTHMEQYRNGPPLWVRRQHARLSRSGPGFDPRSGQVSWVRFCSWFFLTCKTNVRKLWAPKVPEYHLAVIIITKNDGRQWPEVLTRPKTLNIHTYIQYRNAYRVLVGKSEGKRLLERLRRRSEDDIEMDLREVSCEPGDWIDLAENWDQWRAYVRAEMNLRVS